MADGDGRYVLNMAAQPFALPDGTAPMERRSLPRYWLAALRCTTVC
jgi:hypothetical protein